MSKLLIVMMMIVVLVVVKVMMINGENYHYYYEPVEKRPMIKASSSAASNDNQQQQLLTQKFIDEINSLRTTWKAGWNFQSDNIDEEYLRIISSGLLIDDDEKRQQQKQSTKAKLPEDYFDFDGDLDGDFQSLPKEYDVRNEYPQCKTIRLIRDQGKCGSCWAFATTSAFADRLCIQTNGTIDLVLSALDTISCAPGGNGCMGGPLDSAWQWFIQDGVCTGGLYGTESDTCKPYPFLPIANARHVILRKPQCIQECSIETYPKAYQDDKHYAKTYYEFGDQANAESIQMEILRNGPVSAGFIVYDDFAHYKSGVYQRNSWKKLGGHAIVILGWGEEPVDEFGLVPYWLVANSWGPDWGENGTFKILRGHNECRIESFVTVGI